MKLRRALIENVRSFLEAQELRIPGDVAILIGPNGGGKTNLLDTVTLALRLYLLKSWIAEHQPQEGWQDRYAWINNNTLNVNLLDKHSAGANRTQRIELDLEITQRDIDNIERAKAEVHALEAQSKLRYVSNPLHNAIQWQTEHLKAGSIFTYRIVNRNLEAPKSNEAKVFQQYLETFEINSRLRSEQEHSSLSTPMISLPVNRSSSGVAVSVSLASFNESDYKKSVDAASSRSAGSIIMLAVGRLAGRYRDLLELDNRKAREAFDEDESVKALTSTLRALGYEWNLQCTNAHKNQYDIRLSKQGSSFMVSAASSGERELLTYLFAIYALNLRDALIVIDEPELHLHPRWQKTLLGLFEKLGKDTGNQFVMATHSPVFVSPSSIQYVSRVFSESQQTRITRLGDSNLPESRHLFNIVNSQNNERVFFADKVVLVEGISDRIFFEAVLLRFAKSSSGLIYEVVDVGGKMFFDPYVTLLRACSVPFATIADLDYVRQIGTPELKALFSLKGRDIIDHVVNDDSSIDAQNLVARLDEAIRTADLDSLKSVWEYIKTRQQRIRRDLTAEQIKLLETFIEQMAQENIFILSKGTLEDYLPAPKQKDLDKVIRVTTAPDFWEQLPTPVRQELEKIALQIIRPISSEKTQTKELVGS